MLAKISASTPFKRAIAFAVAGALSLGTALPAFAQDHRDEHHDTARRAPDRAAPMRNEHFDWHGNRAFGGPPHSVAVHARPGYRGSYRGAPVARSRWFHNVYVYRPWGVTYPGFGFYYTDAAAFRFLGLTALSFAAFDAMNEAQQRANEEAMVEATSAPIGQPITWDQAGASGTVTAVRDGQTADGRQCREFQQNVEIGGQPQEAYGTACMQPDGSWQVVSQG